MRQLNFASHFNRDDENVMHSMLNRSILKSVNELITKYNFINPAAPEAPRLINKTIANLYEKINREMEKLQARNYIEADLISDDWCLTDKAREALKDNTHKKHARALFALDVIAASHAFNPPISNSYSQPIFLYGNSSYSLSYIIALFWSCCLENKSNAGAGLMLGVTNRAALKAIIHGIAEGVRANNRRTGIDDLNVIDLPCCLIGRNARLVCAFIGIFPEIEIIYDYTDALLDHFKKQILSEFVANAESLDEAKQLLDFWLGVNTLKPSIKYNQLKSSLIGKQILLISSFTVLISDPNSPVRQHELRSEIEEYVEHVEKGSFGLTFIEQVSPNHRELADKWYSLHPDKKHESTTEIASTKRARIS